MSRKRKKIRVEDTAHNWMNEVRAKLEKDRKKEQAPPEKGNDRERVR